MNRDYHEEPVWQAAKESLDSTLMLVGTTGKGVKLIADRAREKSITSRFFRVVLSSQVEKLPLKHMTPRDLALVEQIIILARAEGIAMTIEGNI